MVFSFKKLIPTYMFAEPGGEGFSCPRGQGPGEGCTGWTGGPGEARLYHLLLIKHP